MLETEYLPHAMRSRGGESFGGPLVPARPGIILLAAMIDTLVCVLPAIILIATTSHSVVGIVIGAVIALAQIVAALYTGRTVGLWVTGARVVSRTTGSAPGFRSFDWITANIRHGVDPVALYVPIPQLFLSCPDAATPPVPPPSSSSGAASSDEAAYQPRPYALSVDGDTPIPLTLPAIIGRIPSAPDGVHAIAIPDFGRQLSKSHFLIQQGELGSLWISDLGSTNGTYIDGTELTPFEPYQIVEGSLIEAGEHTVYIGVYSNAYRGGTW